MAEKWAVDLRGISGSEKAILMILAYHHNHKTGQCNPSVKTIGEEACRARHTVLDALAGLVQHDLVRIIPAPKVNHSQNYILNMHVTEPSRSAATAPRGRPRRGAATAPRRGAAGAPQMTGPVVQPLHREESPGVVQPLHRVVVQPCGHDAEGPVVQPLHPNLKVRDTLAKKRFDGGEARARQSTELGG